MSRTVRNMDAVVDRFVVSRRHEKAIKAGIASTLLVGDGLMQIDVLKGVEQSGGRAVLRRGCAARRTTSFMATSTRTFFMFNNPESACRTCGGLGVDKLTHPELLIPDPERSIRGGCFVREAFKYNPDTWDGRMMYSLSVALDFPLDAPVEGPARDRRANAILYGIDPRKVAMLIAARREGAPRGARGQGSWLSRDCPAHRAPLPALPPARRSEFAGWRSGSTR